MSGGDLSNGFVEIFALGEEALLIWDRIGVGGPAGPRRGGVDESVLLMIVLGGVGGGYDDCEGRFWAEEHV